MKAPGGKLHPKISSADIRISRDVTVKARIRAGANDGAFNEKRSRSPFSTWTITLAGFALLGMQV